MLFFSLSPQAPVPPFLLIRDEGIGGRRKTRGDFLHSKFCMTAAVCRVAAGGADCEYCEYCEYCVLFGAPYALPHPAVTHCPEPGRTAASKTTGYNMTCRGVARQGEDGRPHLCQTGQTSQTEASRQRRLHTPVAIKLPGITLR